MRSYAPPPLTARLGDPIRPILASYVATLLARLWLIPVARLQRLAAGLTHAFGFGNAWSHRTKEAPLWGRGGEMTNYRRLVSYFIPLVVSAGLLVVLAIQTRVIALSHDDNTRTFYSFSGGLSSYKTLRQEWRPRILSNYLAGTARTLVKTVFSPRDQREVMLYLPSVWTAGWFFLTCLLFIGTFGIRSVLYVLGLFAGISFAYVPGMGITRVYPWDLPALFFFAVLVPVVEKQRYPWLLGVIPLAVLFKETTLLLAIAFLFWSDVPRRKRLVFFLSAVAIGLVVKGVVDVYTDNPSPVWTMTTGGAQGDSRVDDNVRNLLELRPNHPLLANAGLLVALFVLPVLDNRVMMLKVIASVFAAGIFLFGLVHEYRVWFELIPLSVYGIDIVFFRGSPLAAAAPPDPR